MKFRNFAVLMLFVVVSFKDCFAAGSKRIEPTLDAFGNVLIRGKKAKNFLEQYQEAMKSLQHFKQQAALFSVQVSTLQQEVKRLKAHIATISGEPVEQKVVTEIQKDMRVFVDFFDDHCNTWRKLPGKVVELYPGDKVRVLFENGKYTFPNSYMHTTKIIKGYQQGTFDILNKKSREQCSVTPTVERSDLFKLHDRVFCKEREPGKIDGIYKKKGDDNFQYLVRLEQSDFFAYYDESDLQIMAKQK